MLIVPWDNVGIDDEHATWQVPQHLLGWGMWTWPFSRAMSTAL